MRALYLAILLTAFCSFSHSSFAQECVPDTNVVNPGFYPAELDTVYPGDNHSQTIQIRVIKDTTIILFGFPQKAFIDSVVLRKIIGLPPGFDYKCYNAECRYIPDSTGCAVLFGTAQVSDAGVYPLKLAVDIYGRLAGGFAASQPDTIRSLTLIVKGGAASVIQHEAGKTLVYPNPSNGVFNLSMNPNWLPANFECYSSDGRLLYSKEISTETTALDLSELGHSFYFGTLKSNSGRLLWKGKLSVTKD